jgi:eukaryotic-like serine/threonine-protein kinase
VHTVPRLLGGRYEVGDELGSGGMAAVVEAVDRMLGRRVAIKVLYPHVARDPGVVQRFHREARAVARLSHPNVVAIYDIAHDEGADADRVEFIVMELVEGRTLRAELLDGPLAPARAARVARGVCAALAAAHAAGVVHRDIKPANIMLGAGDRVTVMDFGIAHAVDSDRLTQTGMAIGTAQYASPEQLMGHPVDARSDLYSLGCCLYEMLAGTAPFPGTSAVSVAYRQVNEPPVPLVERNPAVPERLAAVVERAMEKEPARRYQTAAEFGTALSRVLPGLPEVAAPVPAAGEAGARGTDTAPLAAVAAAADGFAAPGDAAVDDPDSAGPTEAVVAPPAGPASPPRPRPRLGRRRLLVGAGLAAFVTAAAGLLGWLVAASPSAPRTTAPQVPAAVTTTGHPSSSPTPSARVVPAGGTARTSTGRRTPSPSPSTPSTTPPTSPTPSPSGSPTGSTGPTQTSPPTPSGSSTATSPVPSAQPTSPVPTAIAVALREWPLL